MGSPVVPGNTDSQIRELISPQQLKSYSSWTPGLFIYPTHTETLNSVAIISLDNALNSTEHPN
jgi:hypothetical protein